MIHDIGVIEQGTGIENYCEVMSITSRPVRSLYLQGDGYATTDLISTQRVEDDNNI